MIDVDESQLSPGKLLLQGRLQAGLTQEQVAKDLYMTVAKVKALETDDYGRLISDTFARGYIRAYANLLKLDVEKVLAAYERLVDHTEPVTVASDEDPKLTAGENSSRGFWQFLAVIGAFFLGLWLISVWFFDNHLEPQEMRYVVPPPTNLPKIDEAQLQQLTQQQRASTAAALLSAVGNSSSSAVSSSVVAQQKNVEQKLVAVTSSATTSSSAASISAMATKAVVAVESEQANSSKKATLDEIYFAFRAECWLEVSDSRGDVLATELQAAGSKIKLVGQAPFDVKLGNAPAVDIQLNGKKIDVIPLMGTNVLIMKVGDH